MIAQIDQASPAAQAKLEPGDVILDYDGKPIERSRQLALLVAGTPPDKSVKLSIWRDRKQQEVTLKVAALDPNRAAAAPTRAGKAETCAQRRRTRAEARQAQRRSAQGVYPGRRGQRRGYHRGAANQRRRDPGAAPGRSRSGDRPGSGREPGRGTAQSRRRGEERREGSLGPGRARRQFALRGAARRGGVSRLPVGLAVRSATQRPATRRPSPARRPARASGCARRPPSP